MTVISWNIENWITVLLMGAAGYFVFVFVAKMLKQASAGGLKVAA